MEVSTIATCCAFDNPMKRRRQETILHGMLPTGQYCAQSL